MTTKLRRKDNHTVVIRLHGYEPYETVLTRQTSGWVFWKGSLRPRHRDRDCRGRDLRRDVQVRRPTTWLRSSTVRAPRRRPPGNCTSCSYHERIRSGSRSASSSASSTNKTVVPRSLSMEHHHLEAGNFPASDREEVVAFSSAPQQAHKTHLFSCLRRHPLRHDVSAFAQRSEPEAWTRRPENLVARAASASRSSFLKNATPLLSC